MYKYDVFWLCSTLAILSQSFWVCSVVDTGTCSLAPPAGERSISRWLSASKLPLAKDATPSHVAILFPWGQFPCGDSSATNFTFAWRLGSCQWPPEKSFSHVLRPLLYESLTPSRQVLISVSCHAPPPHSRSPMGADLGVLFSKPSYISLPVLASWKLSLRLTFPNCDVI